MRINKYLFPFLLVMISAENLFASEDSDAVLYTVAKIMIGVTILMVIIVLWLVIVYSERNDTTGEVFLKPFRKAIAFLTKSTPVEKEHEILMAHNYDGIRELDNKIPPWFHALFWGTIIFAGIYMVRYHVVGSGDIQAKEYQEEIRLANLEREILIKSGTFINEETVTEADDAASLQSGKEIYIKNCVACHAQDGGGLVGPNLADDYWINGGGIKNVFKVIKYGVPQKGMISWQTQLSPAQMRDVASYILTLHGITPANPKAPEGEKWVESTEMVKENES